MMQIKSFEIVSASLLNGLKSWVT